MYLLSFNSTGQQVCHRWLDTRGRAKRVLVPEKPKFITRQNYFKKSKKNMDLQSFFLNFAILKTAKNHLLQFWKQQKLIFLQFWKQQKIPRFFCQIFCHIWYYKNLAKNEEKPYSTTCIIIRPISPPRRHCTYANTRKSNFGYTRLLTTTDTK